MDITLAASDFVLQNKVESLRSQVHTLVAQGLQGNHLQEKHQVSEQLRLLSLSASKQGQPGAILPVFPFFQCLEPRLDSRACWRHLNLHSVWVGTGAHMSHPNTLPIVVSQGHTPGRRCLPVPPPPLRSFYTTLAGH